MYSKKKTTDDRRRKEMVQSQTTTTGQACVCAHCLWGRGGVGRRLLGPAPLQAPPRALGPSHPRPAPPWRARWPGSMAAAAGAPPPGPPHPPPPPPEESSDSEPEAEPGSPQKLIRKVSTSGQIRQKVSPRRQPGARPSRRGPCRGP